MSAYTIEDIELIRRKSGVSYQEAVSLLDYHNGNVARALVDLERNGRIKPDGARADNTRETPVKEGKTEKKGAFMNLITKLYRARIKVHKEDTAVLNLSALFGIVTLLLSPHIAIIGFIACLVLGYKISFTKRDAAFASDNLEKMVRNAAENVKSSVNEFSKSFDDEEPAKESTSAPRTETENRSYYQSKGAASAAYHRSSAPTLNVPVQVESKDGNVTLNEDGDGYTSATIE